MVTMAMQLRTGSKRLSTVLKALVAGELVAALWPAPALAGTDEFPDPDPNPDPEDLVIDCNTYTGPDGAGETAREPAAPTGDSAAETFISNHGQIDGFGKRTYGGTAFQGFTTGGNPAGYRLADISVVLEVPSDGASMEVWTKKGGPLTYRPGRLLHRLVSPPPVPTCETATFVAPPDTTLAPNTTYFARFVDAAVIAWDYDLELDDGTAPGWSLKDGLMMQGLGASGYARYSPNAVISIRGTALLGQPPARSGEVG